MRSRATPSWPANFWAKVDDSAGPSGCWLWTGGRGRDGYGLAASAPLGRNTMTAHRVAYLLAHPAEPEPVMVLHSCDNPPCVNALHLFTGDQAVNMADMKAKGRAKGGRIIGEPFTKLPPSKDAQIAARHAAGEGVRALAREFEVAPNAIRRALVRASSRNQEKPLV